MPSPMTESLIAKIDQNQLCLGCGLCETVCGKESVEMKLGTDGFFHPHIKSINAKGEKIIDQICPGKNVVSERKLGKDERIWGHIEALWEGFSTDNEVRTKGSSGGIVSGLAIYLLETKKVDAIMQVGGVPDNYENNYLKLSKTRQDVLSNSSSRYAPALVFDDFIGILDRSNETYGFVGKPCDIAALQNFLSVYPQYKHRIKVTMAIVCAGMPSFTGTKKLIEGFKAELPVKDLVYRGNGWPGYFSFEDKTGAVYRTSYNDSWGKVLNRHLRFRCKVCPDGIGMLADIAVGDAWETVDGYPDFAEKEGISLIIARSEIGKGLLSEAMGSQAITCQPLPMEKLKIMQPYQFLRRNNVGIRMLAFKVIKHIQFNFKNLRVYSNLLHVPPKVLAKEFYGTFTRVWKFN